MKIIKKPYSEAMVERIYEILQNHHRAGKPNDFEIYVDDDKVIPRTSEIELFNSFSDFVVGSTKSVTFKVYDGGSRRNQRYVLVFAHTGESLNGLSEQDVNMRVKSEVKERDAEIRKEIEFERIKEENKRLLEECEEKDERIDKLKKKLKIARSDKHKIKGWNIGELGSIMLEGIIRRNPQVLSGLPGGEALAGAFQQPPTPPPPTADVHHQEVSFSKVEDEPEASEEATIWSQITHALKSNFTNEEIHGILLLIDELVADKSRIEKTLNHFSRQNFKRQQAADQSQTENENQTS